MLETNGFFNISDEIFQLSIRDQSQISNCIISLSSSEKLNKLLNSVKTNMIQIFTTIIHYINRGFYKEEMIEYFKDNDRFYKNMIGLAKAVIKSLVNFCQSDKI